MSFHVKTQVGLDMTIRITNRDQVTGADLHKLNELLAVVEKLGSDNTPPVVPNPSIHLYGASYENHQLVWDGSSEVEVASPWGKARTYTGYFASIQAKVGDTIEIIEPEGLRGEIYLKLGSKQAENTLIHFDENSVVINHDGVQASTEWYQHNKDATYYLKYLSASEIELKAFNTELIEELLFHKVIQLASPIEAEDAYFTVASTYQDSSEAYITPTRLISGGAA